MKKKLSKTLLLLLFTLIITGCTPKSDLPADEVIATLNDISTLYTECKAQSMTPKDQIIIDGKLVGTIKQSGLFNAKWTVNIQDQDLFYIKFVTNGEINKLENVISSTTYGCYDMNDNCKGYCQERVYGDKDYCYVFLDSEYNEIGYYTDDDCKTLYSSENDEPEYNISYNITSHFLNKYTVTVEPTEECSLAIPLESKIFLQVIKAAEAISWL